MKYENYLKSNLNFIIILPFFLYKSWNFLVEPRIWAEEGTVYLKSAILDGFWSIFELQQGYYSIIPNLTLYFASLGDYFYIPYYTVFISFFFWILLFVLINNINSKYLKDNYYFKFFIGLSIFIVVNSFQEIFLNTINLQFITPIIFAIILLYDFERLGKIQIILFYTILTICCLNGILYFPLIPLLSYKLYKGKEFKALVFFLLLCLFSFSVILFQNPNSQVMGLHERIIGNIKYKAKIILYSENIKLMLLNNWYLFLIPIVLILLYKKQYLVAYFLLTTVLLFIFIDYTKMTKELISRYLSILYCFLLITFFLFFANKKYLQGIISLFLLFWFGKTYFHHDYSYSNKVSKWREEYQNLEKNKPAKIHPQNWQIK